MSSRLAEQARAAEKARREAAVKAAEYEKTAKEELDLFVAQRAAARKVGPSWQSAHGPGPVLYCAAAYIRRLPCLPVQLKLLACKPLAQACCRCWQEHQRVWMCCCT